MHFFAFWVGDASSLWRGLPHLLTHEILQWNSGISIGSLILSLVF